MADSLKQATNALGRGEPGEALVYLWTALDTARGADDERALGRIERVAQSVAAEGDESERAEAERLVGEIARARGETRDEAMTVSIESGEPTFEPTFEPDVEPAPADEDDEAEPKKGSRLWSLVGLAIFVFFILRDVLR